MKVLIFSNHKNEQQRPETRGQGLACYSIYKLLHENSIHDQDLQFEFRQQGDYKLWNSGQLVGEDSTFKAASFIKVDSKGTHVETHTTKAAADFNTRISGIKLTENSTQIGEYFQLKDFSKNVSGGIRVSNSGLNLLVGDDHWLEFYEPGYALIRNLYQTPLLKYLTLLGTETEELKVFMGYKNIRFSLGTHDFRHVVPHYEDSPRAAEELLVLYCKTLETIRAFTGCNLIEVCEPLAFPSEKACQKIPPEWLYLDKPFYGDRGNAQGVYTDFLNGLIEQCKMREFKFLYRPEHITVLDEGRGTRVLDQVLDDTYCHVNWYYGLYERKRRGVTV